MKGKGESKEQATAVSKRTFWRSRFGLEALYTITERIQRLVLSDTRYGNETIVNKVSPPVTPNERMLSLPRIRTNHTLPTRRLSYIPSL